MTHKIHSPNDSFLTSLLDFWKLHRMGTQAQRVIIACSGGPDSMALLMALAALRSDIRLPMLVVTIDHQLRDVRDELSLVSTTCQALGLQWCCESVTVTGGSGSLANDARRVRLAKLRELAGSNAVVALGHTADDQAETLLLRLFRGTGTRGLAGMAPVRLPFVRPLLNTWKADILSYLSANSTHFATDPTNNTDRFARNRLRRNVVPIIESWFPGAMKQVAGLARRAQADRRLIERLVDQAVKDCTVDSGHGRWTLSVARLRSHPLDLLPHVFGRVYRRVTRRFGDLYEDHIVALTNLVLKPTGDGHVDLPGATADRFSERLQMVTSVQNDVRTPHTSGQVVVGLGCFRLSDGRLLTLERTTVSDVTKITNPDELWLDATQVRFPWIVRTWQFGDRMSVFGMKGTKKVSDILVDDKIPRDLRPTVLVIEEAGRVLWLVGVRRSAYYPLSADTQVAIRVRLHRSRPLRTTANGLLRPG